MDSVALTLVGQEVCANCSSHALKCSVMRDNVLNCCVTMQLSCVITQSCHSDSAPTCVFVYSACLLLCFNDIFSFLLVGGAGGYS